MARFTMKTLYRILYSVVNRLGGKFMLLIVNLGEELLLCVHVFSVLDRKL